MGRGFVDDLGEEQFKTLSQSLVDPNGARILEAQLQQFGIQNILIKKDKTML